MDLKEILTIDKGLSVILSGLVIYFIYILIRNVPKYAENVLEIMRDNAIVTNNNTYVMTEVKESLKLAKGRYQGMADRLDKIENTVEELQTTLENYINEDSQKIIELINDIKNDVNSLKRGH